MPITKKSPSIFFKVNAINYYSNDMLNHIHNDSEKKEIEKNIKKSNFYRSKSKFDFCKYIDRNEATQENDIKPIDEKDYINYSNERPGSTGIFSKNGVLNKNELKELKTSLRNNTSTIWDAVLSFKKEYSAKYCKNKNDAANIIKNTLPLFFINAGFDPNNIIWFAAFHINTDNPHIHLAFFEKDKNIKKINGTLTNKNYFLKKDALKFYREKVAFFCEHTVNKKYALRESIKKLFLNQLHKKNNYESIKILFEKLNDDETKQYNRLNYKNKKIIRDFVTHSFSLNPKLKKTYNEYESHLIKEQLKLIKTHKENKTKINKNTKNFVSNRINELNLRIYNMILKELTNIKKPPKNTGVVLRDVSSIPRVKRQKQKALFHNFFKSFNMFVLELANPSNNNYHSNSIYDDYENLSEQEKKELQKIKKEEFINE